MRQPFLLFISTVFMKEVYQRTLLASKNALPKARKTIWWLLKIIIPTSLVVTILQHFGAISFISVLLTPVFSLIGLPGESAIVFISSIFLPLYAPIAIIANLALNMREITILALMCLISHNMIVETAIQRKTGSSYPVMFLLRIITSFISAAMLNWLLPESMGEGYSSQIMIEQNGFSAMILQWLVSAGWLIVKIVLIITGLMILQNILKEFKILTFLSSAFAPLMKIFGLSKDSSFLWLVGQTLGLTYGSAVMIEQVEEKEIDAPDANLLNYHIAINHSLLEDTLLFVAIGVPVLWITFPRILLAIVAVWIVRIILKNKLRS